MCGVFYPKSGVFLGFWVVFWVGVFGPWGGVLGPWCSGHTVHGICWKQNSKQQMPRQQIFWQQIPRQQTENQNHLFLGKMGDFQG